MSGPKTSRYTLDLARRMRLEEERRKRLEEERKRVEEQRKRTELGNKFDEEILNCIRRVNYRFHHIESILSKIEIIDDFADAIEQLKKSVDDAKKRDTELRNNFSELSSYKRTSNKEISNKDINIKKETLEKLKKIKNEEDNLYKDIVELKNNSEKIYDDISREIERNIQDAFSLSWDIEDEQNPQEGVNKEIIDKIISELEGLADMDLSEELNLKVQNAIKSTENINEIEYLKNFKTITVTPLMKECKNYFEVKEKYEVIFNDLSDNYNVLCKSLDIKPESFVLSEESCVSLKSKIAKLEKEIAEEEEQEYIAEAIDEVMQDMGYNLIGTFEATKSNGQRFKNELYDFGDGTAVNVRYDNKQHTISMELGAIDNCEDRIPTYEEAVALSEEMETFCNVYPEFEKRLSQKGVVRKDKIQHFPPSIEYAQIINTSNYDMKQEVQSFKVSKHKRRYEDKKVYRKE